MAVCRATKATGEPCKAPATGPHGYCWAHDPAKAEQRRRMASRAARSPARSKPSRELAEIRDVLKGLAWRLLDEDSEEAYLEPGTAAVMVQVCNARLRVIEQERKLREAEDLEVRKEALEAQVVRLANYTGVSRAWGRTWQEGHGPD